MVEEPVVTVTDATFGDVVLANERPVVVDFWAEWCKPCVMISKSLRELAEEYGERVVIAKIDADVNPESVRTYNIMSMPTLLVFRKGEVVGSMVGAKPKASLRKSIDELIS
jgi:thioredoxin 1